MLPPFAAFLFSLLVFSLSNAVAAGKENFSIPILVSPQMMAIALLYAHMFSLVHLYRIPVTLFVYPSAISNADYALTWEQLLELKETWLFDIQSHSYWHPNFKEEKRRRLCISEGRTIKTIAVIPELNVPA